MTLLGKTALVTGATRGIGRSIALELGRRGATVVLVGRTETAHPSLPGTLGETKGFIEQAGGKAVCLRADLLEEGETRRIVEDTFRIAGRIDILVNNAANTGAPVFEPLEKGDPSSWRRSVELNLNVPWELIYYASPHMRGRGSGVIINISSGAGLLLDRPVPQLGDPGWLGAVYPTTKAGLNQMTRYLSEELRPSGVVLFAVDPGYTRTEAVDYFAAEYGRDLSESHTMESVSGAIGKLIESETLPACGGRIIGYSDLLALTS